MFKKKTVLFRQQSKENAVLKKFYSNFIPIPLHCRFSSCWYDTTVTPNTPLLGATKRLCCISQTLHQIHGRDVLTWIFYLLSGCHLLSWRTHKAPHLQQTVCHRTSAYGASACTVSPVFLRVFFFLNAQFYQWHFCCCKMPAVKTKVPTTLKTATVSPASWINRLDWFSSVPLPTPDESSGFWCLRVYVWVSSFPHRTLVWLPAVSGVFQQAFNALLSAMLGSAAGQKTSSHDQRWRALILSHRFDTREEGWMETP